MGEYTKLIVNCSLKKMEGEELALFEAHLDSRIYIGSSASHCAGEVLKIDNRWHHRTDLTIVTQIKNGTGLREFLLWLHPQVIGGSGEDSAWAMTWTEYQREPDIWYLEDGEPL